MILLSNEDVEKALTPEDAIAATETIYRELAEGKAINRPRSQTYMPVESVNNPGFKYRFKSQEGSGVASGVWALRITSDMAGFSFTNGVKRRRILPVATGNRYCGLVILFDLERIEPIAIMPDGVIQKVRVAALSVVGAKYLAPAKPRVLGLFGSGWQASAHVEFLSSEFAFEKVKIYSPNQDHCRAFCAHWSAKLRREIECVDSSRKVVEGSDFVQAATAAWDAVFDGQLVEKGMYIASIGGSDASNKRREIDDETIRRADLYVVHSKDVARLDQSPDVWEVAQKGIKSWDSIAEVQDLVAGAVNGRTSSDQITVFNNNTGAGTQFAAVGAAVLKRAKAMGLGRELPTEWFTEDVSP
ncbi:MAG TPA: ornithine cyclodeaminase family protein [Bryobacteraceae bacterium]|jgi:ornithine cyclodeaminase/alanine dehydrogenase-like protein (mu-crystallin family)|nr:ornithine cyclodeaminase family protein [Bryobacteraceae bacterium]